MYNAKIEINNSATNVIQIKDVSESDEAITRRELFVTDGYGNTQTLVFDTASNAEYINIDKDMAYKFSFKATPTNAEQEGSIYTVDEYFANTTYADQYLLRLMNKMHCDCGCKTDNDLQIKIFTVINNIEGAQRLACCCEIFRAQSLLDYIADYSCNDTVSKYCGCGKEY